MVHTKRARIEGKLLGRRIRSGLWPQHVGHQWREYKSLYDWCQLGISSWKRGILKHEKMVGNLQMEQQRRYAIDGKCTRWKDWKERRVLGRTKNEWRWRWRNWTSESSRILLNHEAPLELRCGAHFVCQAPASHEPFSLQPLILGFLFHWVKDSRELLAIDETPIRRA